MSVTSAVRVAALVACSLTATTAVAALSPPLRPAWQLACPQGFYSPPAVLDGTVYASDVGGAVRAVNLADGTVKWTFKAQESLYSGVAVAARIGYVGSVDKTLYALDLATGQPRWSKTLDGLVYATPAVAGGLVVVGTGDSGTVYALDAATGAEHWTYRLGGRLGSGLTVADGLVYLPSYDRHLHAVDLATGQLRWRFAAETTVDSQPLAADGRVYAKLTNDAVVALDAGTGRLLWRTRPLLARVGAEPTAWSPLARVGDRLLYALSDGRLQAVAAATGERVWVSGLGLVRTAPPTPVGDLGYLGTKEGALVAVDLRTGATVWQWTPPQPSAPQLISGVMWPPVVVGEWLLTASMDGHLYAFQSQPQRPAPSPGRPAYTQSGPGRIALGGLHPMGYAGCLARHGLPRDLLYEAQLTQLETLRRYDLVVLAGAPDNAAISQTVQQYLQGGGAAIVDYSGAATTWPNLPFRNELAMWSGGQSSAPGGFGVRGLSLAPQPIAATSGPLAGIPLDKGLVGDKVVGYLPDPGKLADVQVLAAYPSTVTTPPGKAQANPLGGPGGPAVLLGRLGQGRVVLCGYQVGVKTEHSGLDLEALILALVKLATDGRAIPQLVPDTPHVGYKATLGSLSQAADDADEPPAPAVLTEAAAGPGPRGPLPKGFALVEAEPADEYLLSAKVPARTAELLLRYQNSRNFVKVTLGPGGLEVGRTSEGRAQPLARLPEALTPGQPLIVRDTCDTLAICSGRSYLRADLRGLPAGALAQRGCGADLAYEPTESVYFTDDFMRTDQDPGPWRTSGGKWTTTPEQNPEMGANPFSYKCDATAGAATALTGEETWQEYQFACAVQPTGGGDRGAVGLGWYARDAANLYLLQAAVRPTLSPVPAGWRLLRLVNGQATVLAQRPGGVVVGQWYRLRVRAEGPRLTAEVDGVPVLSAEDSTFRGGGLALWSERAAVRFDDVVATAAVLDPPAGARIEGRAPDQAGLIDVDSWASPATGWEPDPEVDGLFWRRNRFLDEVDLSFDWPRLPDGGEVHLIVDGDGASLDSGYTLRLRRSGDVGHLELRQRAQVLKSADAPVGEAVSLTLRQRAANHPNQAGIHLEGLLGGRTALAATVPTREGGQRLGFRTLGFLPRTAALSVWAGHLEDYTFDSAPCDWWVGSGTWDLTNRWSCVPEWSWFGGYSEQQAVIWSKREYGGDLVLDYYVGAKMLDQKTPGYRGPAQERTGDFNVTICGDGQDPASGYSFTIGPRGAPGEYSRNGRISGATAQLRRGGQVVAHHDAFSLFRQGHNRWANVRVVKEGPTVSLLVDGQLVIRYQDPAPLDRGHVGVWTQNNGILLPRITIAYERLGDEVLSLR